MISFRIDSRFSRFSHCSFWCQHKRAEEEEKGSQRTLGTEVLTLDGESYRLQQLSSLINVAPRCNAVYGSLRRLQREKERGREGERKKQKKTLIKIKCIVKVYALIQSHKRFFFFKKTQISGSSAMNCNHPLAQIILSQPIGGDQLAVPTLMAKNLISTGKKNEIK